MSRHGFANDAQADCDEEAIGTIAGNGHPGQAEAPGSICPPGRSAAPDDGHGGPETWQNWSEDKKLQRQLSMGGHRNHQHRLKLNTITVVTALWGPTVFSADLGANVNAFHDKQFSPN